jgi:hypothetical protein
MLFDKPILFEDAVKSAKGKALLPSTLSSAELAGLPTQVRQVAVMSARVFEAKTLQSFVDVAARVLAPYEREDGNIEGLNLASAKAELKSELKRMGYEPPDGERGRITDLSSDQRLELVVRTRTDLARGYGQWKQGQDRDMLDLWPAQELYRAEDRMEPRDWPMIWQEAAGRVDTKALEAYKLSNGRYLALKDSPIWMEISDFARPHPPFKFNSGMWVQDVERDEAINFGLMGELDSVAQTDGDLIDAMEESAEGISPAMRETILEEMGPAFEFKEGVLTRA